MKLQQCLIFRGFILIFLVASCLQNVKAQKSVPVSRVTLARYFVPSERARKREDVANWKRRIKGESEKKGRRGKRWKRNKGEKVRNNESRRE